MVPSASPQPARASRRRDIRIQILGQLYGQVVALDLPLAVQNLGAGGFAVDSPIPFQTGTMHQFQFTLDDGRTVKLDARAVHCLRVRVAGGSARYLVGLEFVRPSEDSAAAAAIDALLDSALASLTFT
jgi:hypothetical protein